MWKAGEGVKAAGRRFAEHFWLPSHVAIMERCPCAGGRDVFAKRL